MPMKLITSPQLLISATLLMVALPGQGGPYDPIAPPIGRDDKALFTRCASGAVQKKLPRARALVMPAINRTQAPTLQPLLEDAFAKLLGDLSFEVYPGSLSLEAGGLNSVVADPMLYDYVVRGELSMVDRATTTEELKREFGVDFGGGRFDSWLGAPSTERWTVGWVTATVNVYKTQLRMTSSRNQAAGMRLAAAATARSAFFTLGNSDGLNASIVLTYGRQTTVERQAGMQRAAVAALTAGAAKAALLLTGYDGEVCGL